MKKHEGFSLIELVIVVAIIGILALMIIPQFNNVTEDAREKTWQSNCQTVVSAIAMYQAAHAGAYPDSVTALDPYLQNGFAALNGAPTGATYTITPGDATTGSGFNFSSEYTPSNGGQVKKFSYPTTTNASTS